MLRPDCRRTSVSRNEAGIHAIQGFRDGRKIRIDDVLDVRRAVSLRAGGTGDRYTCEISGNVVFLFDKGAGL